MTGTRNSNLPDGFKDTEIGPIPVEWEVVPLKDAVALTRKPRGLNVSDYEAVPFIPMELVPDNGTSIEQYELKPGSTIRSGTYCEKGDILLAKITPSFENGKQGIVGDLPLDFAYATTEVYPIQAMPGRLDRMFLFHFLRLPNVRADIAGKMEGSTGRQRVPKAVIENYPIPLPPLPEQQRIAHVLSTIQRAIVAQDALIAAARQVKRSLMQRLFTHGPGAEPAPTKETEIGEMPGHWEVVQLGDLAQIVMGQSPPGNSYNQSGDGIPLINGPAEFGDKFPIFVKWTSQPTKVCQIGDILFCVRGNTTGRMNIADDEYCIGRGVASIRGIDELSDTSYLFFLLERKTSEIFNIAVAGGSTFPNITKSQLENLKVPSPSLAEQQHIADMLSVVDRKIEAEEQRKAALQALFKAMLHQLMTGQIRLRDVE